MQSGAETIKITDLSHDGRGVGRADSKRGVASKACFVAGALPGETVRWRRTQTKRSFDEGELVEIIEPSPDRVAPRCQYAHECGGCELQHLDSNAQLRIKEQQLKNTFAREGIEPESWLPPLAGSPWEYRRRTRLAVAFAGNRTIVGYRQRASRRVIPIDTCVVLEPALNQMLAWLEPAVAGLKPWGLDQIKLVLGESSNEGADRKENIESSQRAICLSVNQTPDANALKPLKETCAEQGVQLWIRAGKEGQGRKGEKGSRKTPSPVEDYPPLNTRLTDELSMQFSPAQFVQTNAEMNRKMISQALELLELKPEHRALDLFCGAGNFSLPIAKSAKSMLGVEGLPDLIAQADMNAKRQGLHNAEFRVADLSKADALTDKAFAKTPTKAGFDRVLLDPPRTGAKDLMPPLVRMQAPKLVYVSCHPATLVRDIKILIDGGYRLSKAGVIDMFPQTTHLEAIASLEFDG